MSIDFLELLLNFIPSDYELKLLVNYEKDGRPMEDLADEDRFMLNFGRIPRLQQRLNTLTFMGNFSDMVKCLQPVSGPTLKSNLGQLFSSNLFVTADFVLLNVSRSN